MILACSSILACLPLLPQRILGGWVTGPLRRGRLAKTIDAVLYIVELAMIRWLVLDRVAVWYYSRIYRSKPVDSGRLREVQDIGRDGRSIQLYTESHESLYRLWRLSLETRWMKGIQNIPLYAGGITALYNSHPA